MICKACPAGRRYMSGSIYCMEYGMILNEDHECNREGWRDFERDERKRGTVPDETEVQSGGSGPA